MGGEPGKWLSTEGTKLMMFLLANFQGHLCMLMVHVGMFMLHFLTLAMRNQSLPFVYPGNVSCALVRFMLH